MADNVTVTAGSGTTIKTDQDGSGFHWQYVKLGDGTADSTAVIPGDATNGLYTNVRKISGAATATLTNVAASASTQQLLAANTSRLDSAVYNDSTASMYIKLGTTASTTSFTCKVSPAGYFAVPAGYTGRIDAIWDSATGSARITELT